MKKLNLFITSLILLSSCTSDQKDVQELRYYDIKGFFEKEVAKFSKSNPAVDKTTSHNAENEQKVLKIDNWQQELALFTASDINKSSWQDAYRVDSLENKVVYTALEDKLRTRKIEIDFVNKQPSKFTIYNNVANYLYQSEEQLTYYPDSLYSISKKHDVVLLGENNYSSIGKIVK